MSAISFGVFCRDRALDEADHPVEEALAGLRGHPDLEPVGDHTGAAGDRRAVAAALADHGRRFAGDRALVDRSDALDHLAVRRDDVAGLDQHEVIQASDRGSRPARTPCVQAPRGASPGSPAACRAARRRCALPRPSATASAKLANSTVNQSQAAIWPVEPGALATCAEVAQEGERRQHRDHLDHEHDRVPDQAARIELADRARAPPERRSARRA